jgi:hypothetical protein
MVGAIHGRLLTAWSTAGIIGPVVVNYIREFQLEHGVSQARAYDVTLYLLSGLLLLGLLCNLLVRPVADRHFMSDEALRRERERAHDTSAVVARSTTAAAPGDRALPWLVLSWLAVGVPLAWGVWVTLGKAALLFG